MTLGNKLKENKNNEQKKEDQFETKAIIKLMNVYNPESGKYTEQINQKVVKVETFVKNLKEEKPVVIGYINVATLERFLSGEVKAVPIKIKKSN
jgi:hypothetical protein